MRRKQNSHTALNRREFLKYGAYGSLTAGLASSIWLNGCSKRNRKAKPNILFILIDTLRADHLPSYGYKINTAPNIQRLARQGVLFDRVIAPSSWTKTSIASIMTSLNPSRHGVLGVRDSLSGNLTTLAECLSTGGYHTIGINTNPWLKPGFGFKAGFDTYVTHTLVGGYDMFAGAWKVNNKAQDLLRERPQNKPLFLYLHYMDVHAPYRPKPPFFAAPALTIPNVGIIPDGELEHQYRKKGLQGSGVQQRVLDLYDGTIRTIDAAVGQLVEEMQRIGLFENTIFVITSDHGEQFREHGKTEHGYDLYPEVYEVPLLLLWPNALPAGIRIGAQVRSIDIAPTLLAQAGLAVPKSFEGEPLLPMETGALKDRIALSAVGLNDYIPDLHYAAVVSREHLYLREKNNNIVEFYDLASDPGAQHNLGASHPKAAFYSRLEEGTTGRTTEQVELDQQTINQLKSLGYLE